MSVDLPDFQAILLCLTDAGAEFVLVGGVGAVLRGAPVVTFDLDIVHRRTALNVSRLLAVLSAIDARYPGKAGASSCRIQPISHPMAITSC